MWLRLFQNPRFVISRIEFKTSVRFVMFYLIYLYLDLQGMPGSVQIYACAPDSQSEPIARRSFFRCSSVQQHWNNGSTGLLVVVQSDVDKTNQSYYGETKLYYLTLDGSHDGLVSLRKFVILTDRV